MVVFGFFEIGAESEPLCSTHVCLGRRPRDGGAFAAAQALHSTVEVIGYLRLLVLCFESWRTSCVTDVAFVGAVIIIEVCEGDAEQLPGVTPAEQLLGMRGRQGVEALHGSNVCTGMAAICSSSAIPTVLAPRLCRIRDTVRVASCRSRWSSASRNWGGPPASRCGPHRSQIERPERDIARDNMT